MSETTSAKSRKAALRKDVLARRDALPPEEHACLSRVIVEKILQWPALVAAQRLLLYVNFRSEIRTDELIAELLKQGKHVVLPKVERNPSRLGMYEIKAFPQDLAPGPWGILEPVPERCREVSLEEIDFILAPGVAFDLQGRRLGYGGGFYDGIMATLQARLAPEQILAAAFDFQIVPEVPAKKKDIPVPYILTDKRLIRAQTMSHRDCIRLSNMTFYGHHGVEDSERRLGGRFAMDIELVRDLTGAGQTDDLTRTVDYKAVYDLIRQIEAAQDYQLMEALAHDVVQAILEKFEVDEVTVKVRKQSVPLGGLVDYAEVEMTRQKEEGKR